MFKVYKNGEISIDFNQWLLGFNVYDSPYKDCRIMVNLFFGPVRISYHKGLHDKIFSSI